MLYMLIACTIDKKPPYHAPITFSGVIVTYLMLIPVGTVGLLLGAMLPPRTSKHQESGVD
jgi:hypothetical protein